MNEVVLKNRKVNIQKLTAFGFSKSETGYIYSAEVIDNQMELTVIVTEDEKITALFAEDEYKLYF